MKKALSSPDLRVLVEGWQSLIGARVEQVQRPEANLLHFKLRHRQHGGLRLLVDLQGWTWLGDAPAGAPTSGGFITELRRHIRKARLEHVAQLSADRILELRFSVGEARPVLLLELFHRGNALLCEEGVIVQALRRQKFRHRTLAPDEKYHPPPATFDPFTTSKTQFSKQLASSERELVPALAVECNLGGDLAETIAWGFAGTRAMSLPASTSAELWQRLRKLLDDERQPAIFFRAGEPVTVSPFLLEGYDERRDFQSLDEAIAAFRELRPPPAKEPDANERRLTKQRAAAVEFEAEAIKLRSNGDLLFAHTDAASEAMRKDKSDHRGRLTIELDGHELELDTTLSIEANASLLFDAAKRLEHKAARARKLAVAPSPSKRKPATPAAPQEWFERYRWFIASTGEIVVAGRDANSNDRVVKRYLKQDDCYAHADIHGAPSVVVKHGAKSPSEAAMEEACRFSLACSRAWGAGVASGHAYWVEQDQVSKTPPTGEFLPKGAFMLRGRRNWHRNLPVELALGEIEWEGALKLMAGPVAAVQAHGRRWVTLKPGFTERKALIGQLATAFRQSREAIEKLLPGGEYEIVSMHHLDIK
ncbi:MAG: hypothetical protein CL964_01360 [Euryarchaeota archaeon]|nr:hypothetical protein [Euryarchaeota archaeon]HIH78692.1 fibronectin-binding domain-containing protein [Candidatus Poseidoniia archaeon]